MPNLRPLVTCKAKRTKVDIDIDAVAIAMLIALANDRATLTNIVKNLIIDLYSLSNIV